MRRSAASVDFRASLWDCGCSDELADRPKQGRQCDCGVDIQFIVTVNLMMLSLSAIVVTLILRPQGSNAWVLTNVALVLIGACALFLVPQWSGTIMICVAVPMVIGPLALSAVAQRRAEQNRLREAAFYSRLAAFFYPAGRNHFEEQLTKALAIVETEASITALDALAEHATPEQKTIIRAWTCRARDDWEGVLEYLPGLPNSTSARPLQIRAFGELGRIGDMVRAYAEGKTGLSGSHLHYAQLFVMAFCGRVSGVEFILRHQLAALPDEAKAYWIAVAMLASGEDAELARRFFDEIERTAIDAKMRMAAHRRLTVPFEGNVAALTPDLASVPAGIEARLQRDANRQEMAFNRIPVTLTLLAINFVFFIIENLMGGSENLNTLVHMGALTPELVLKGGQWWRLASSLVLHYGLFHLFANSFSLFLVGRMVENLVGSVRMFIVYLLGGVISSAAVLTGMWLGATNDAVLVGASGAIFAILGLEVARQGLNWFHSRDVLDRRELIVLFLIVAIQFGIDLSIPEISFTAHASGFIAGIVLGLIMALFGGGRLVRRAVSAE